MKIKRSQLERIVREELARHIHEQLDEAKPQKASVTDGDEDKKGKERDKGKGEKVKTEPQDDVDNVTTRPKTTGKPAGDPPEEAPDMELPADPADDELEKDVSSGDEGEDDAGPDDGDTEDPADAEKSDISDELTGKTIQSITMEPKSKLMPGAVEVNITFDQVADTFRILIGKSGVVKFYYRGLHNTL